MTPRRAYALVSSFLALSFASNASAEAYGSDFLAAILLGYAAVVLIPIVSLAAVVHVFWRSITGQKRDRLVGVVVALATWNLVWVAVLVMTGLWLLALPCIVLGLVALIVKWRSAALTKTTFLEIALRPSAEATYAGRDEVEGPLHEELLRTGIGEVTGSGTGTGTFNIDVEVTDLPEGLAVIRQVLSRLGVPRDTVINQYDPERATHRVYLEIGDDGL